ncbi:MAG: S1C family serine protease [Armatimonadota bacterium]
MGSERTVEEVISDVKFSVVQLQNREGVGTGFLINQQGYLLTCNHVATTDEMDAVWYTGTRMPAMLYAREPATDLAVFKIEKTEAEPLMLADPLSITEGQTAFALGHPLGFEFTVSRGVVSSRCRTLGGVDYIQFDLSINPGNSGGPVINEHGAVVGVADWRVAEHQGLGFAIAVRHMFSFLASLRIPCRRDEVHFR